MFLKFLLFFSPIAAFAGWQGELMMKTENTPPAWMSEQIREDLSGIEPSELASETLSKGMAFSSEELFLVRYRINKLEVFEEYHSSKEGHPRLKDFKQSLQDLLSCLPMPDLDFVVCLADSIDSADLSAPVFAFAKSLFHKKKIILVPDFEALQHTEPVLKSVLKGIKKYPWDKKKSKAFWRGACTGGTFNLDNFRIWPRSELVTLSHSFPKMINARLVLPLVQSDDPVSVAAAYSNYFGESCSIKDHLQYKYQILIDGNSCAYARAYWQLFSDTVMFKQDSPNIQWYYRALAPNVHYIPFQTVSELLSKLEWAKNHDKEVKKISRNAQKFAYENLKKSDVYYYLYLLLKEYSKIQGAH
jgi:hypothetical protein